MSWFPILKEQLEDENFLSLTTSAKIHYLLTQSEFNICGKHYKSDLWYATALGLNIGTVRKNRRKFVKHGWMKITPGTRTKRQKLATIYTEVMWANVPDQGLFVKFDRYRFQMLLFKLREGLLKVEDVWLYIVLTCWRYFKSAEDFFVTKFELRRLIGFHGIEKSIMSLYAIHSEQGKRLFEFEDLYTRYEFTKWLDESKKGFDKERERLIVMYYRDIEQRVKFCVDN